MGARVTVNNSAKIAAAVSRQLEQVVAKAAFDVEANAKLAAPVDTGFLRATIAAGKTSPKRWRVAAFAFYAKFIEFGTVNRDAHPFLVPALDRVLPSLKAAIKRIRTR